MVTGILYTTPRKLIGIVPSKTIIFHVLFEFPSGEIRKSSFGNRFGEDCNTLYTSCLTLSEFLPYLFL